MTTFLAAIDCGTSAIKAGVFTPNGTLKGLSRRPFPGVLSRTPSVEYDPHSFVREALFCLRQAIRRAGVDRSDIAALSITSQRATMLGVDEKGSPAGNALSWQDLRGEQEVRRFRRKISDEVYYAITGLPLDPVFSLAKILWIKRHDPGRYRKTRTFVLMPDYLFHVLGGGEYITDWSNASLTGMMRLSDFTWSNEILFSSGIGGEKLPLLVPPGQRIGAISREAAGRCGLLEGTPLISGGGDQQCAGLGAGAVVPGIVEITLGTAGALLTTTDTAVKDPARRVNCCAHAVPGKWEIEGLLNAVGESLRWFNAVTGKNEIFSGRLWREISRVAPGAGGVMFYPFLYGASAPHWNPNARAAFLSLSHTTDRATLWRAIMEGISFEIKQIAEAFASLKVPVREIRLTGGCSQVEPWNQMQADILGRPVSTLECADATLLGAAILAACGVGIYRSPVEAARSMVRTKKIYNPIDKNKEMYYKIYERYCRSYDKVF